MTTGVAGVVLLSVAISYFYNVRKLEIQTQEKLRKHVIERVEREETIFQLAQDNLAIAKIAFEKNLAEFGNRDSGGDNDLEALI
jgi:hypothetical protein